MPLSEDEQRILRQIEEHLQRDAGFAETLHTRRHGNRRWFAASAFGAVVCLVVTVILLSVSPLLSFVAFVGALTLGLAFERQARVLGSESISQLQDSVREKFNQTTRGQQRPEA